MSILKKAISMLLAVLMIFGAAAAGICNLNIADIGIKAEAVEIISGDYVYYVDNNAATITEYNGSETGVLTIPSELDGYTVVAIDDNVFGFCSAYSIIIPEGVKSIGDSAFSWALMTSVTIPYTVTEIGDNAFENTDNLTDVYFGGTESEWERIGYTDFDVNNEFENDELDNVVTVHFEDFVVNEDYSGMCGDNLAWTFYRPDRELVISGSGDMYDYNIKTSSPWSEYNYMIETVSFDDTVTSIGDYAFYGCSAITSVSLSEQLERIGKCAFRDCDKLWYINLPSKVTEIGEGAFAYCDGLQSISIPAANKYYSTANGVLFDKAKTTLIHYPAANTYTEYTVPSTVKTIEKAAFYGSENLTSVIIPASADTICEQAFYNCSNLSSVSLPDTVKHIKENAFKNTGYYNNSSNWTNGVLYIGKHLIASDGVSGTYSVKSGTVTIADYAFSEDELNAIVLPASLKTIGTGAFNRTGIKKLTIPENVEKIYGITSGILEFITVDVDNKYYVADENGVLFNKDKTELVEFPGRCSITEYTVPSGVKVIGNSAFAISRNLERVILPSTVVTIGEGAFSSCYSLTNIVIPEGVTTIGDVAFGYTSLTELDIPDTVTEIGFFAFGNCAYLEKVILGNGVKKIGLQAFAYTAINEVCFTGSETEWNSIEIAEGNDPLINANIEFNYVIPHTHTAKAVTVAATCTVDGMKYEICTGCGEKLGEITVIKAAGHKAGNWEVVAQATTEKDGKRVQKCTVCKSVIKEEIIPKFAVTSDKDTGVSMEYSSGDYDYDVEITVDITFDGAAFNLIDSQTNASQSFVYDIKMTVNGVEVQPKGKVTMRIPLPSGYNPETTYVYYVNTNAGKVEKMNSSYENGYMVFETDHFSYYALVDESASAPEVTAEIRKPSTTTISYGDSIILHADVTNLPAGAYIEWTSSDNGNFSYVVSKDGTTCTITPETSGNTTFTATVYDSNGKVLDSDEQVMTAKAGFFDKIIAFFKKLFGMTKVIPQFYEE